MHASHATPSSRHASPLGRVFWLYGVIPSNLLWLGVLWLMTGGGTPSATLGLLAFLLVYTAWILVAVWRAAPQAHDPRYGVLARALTVAWAINTVLLVFFLGLPLLR